MLPDLPCCFQFLLHLLTEKLEEWVRVIDFPSLLESGFRLVECFRGDTLLRLSSQCLDLLNFDFYISQLLGCF